MPAGFLPRPPVRAGRLSRPPVRAIFGVAPAAGSSHHSCFRVARRASETFVTGEPQSESRIRVAHMGRASESSIRVAHIRNARARRRFGARMRSPLCGRSPRAGRRRRLTQARALTGGQYTNPTVRTGAPRINGPGPGLRPFSQSQKSFQPSPRRRLSMMRDVYVRYLPARGPGDRLSESLVAYPSRLSEPLVRAACPGRLSGPLIRAVC